MPIPHDKANSAAVRESDDWVRIKFATSRISSVAGSGRLNGGTSERRNSSITTCARAASPTSRLSSIPNAANSNNKLPQQRAYRDDTTLTGQIGMGVRTNVQRAQRAATDEAYSVTNTRGNPDSPARRRYPGTCLGQHRHRTAGDEDQLMPVMDVLRDDVSVVRIRRGRAEDQIGLVGDCSTCFRH